VTIRMLLCTVAITLPARATAEDVAAAEASFARAKKLAKAGEWEQACPLYEDSYRADPQLGSLLNLADCHEHIGRTATAWAEFRKAAEEAKRRNDGRERFAKTRAEALRDRMVTLTIRAPSDAPRGLTVHRGDDDVTAQLGQAMPVDPGRYPIVVSAPGFADWKTTAKLRDDNIEIAIPRLEPIETKRPEPSATTTTNEQPRSVAATATTERRGKSRQKKLALAVGFGGLGVVGAGAALGLLALNDRSIAIDHCPNNRCDELGTDAANDAKLEMIAADVAFGVGAAAIITGIVLWVTDSKPRGNERRITIVPTMNGAAITGSF
jgi:hypothetical protein